MGHLGTGILSLVSARLLNKANSRRTACTQEKSPTLPLPGTKTNSPDLYNLENGAWKSHKVLKCK